MSLTEKIMAFFTMPNTLNESSKEIKTIMSKVTELQEAVEEMKMALANEADELFTKMEEMQAQIDARVDPSSLQPVIDSIKGTAENIQALSEGRPVAPAPEEPAVEEPTEEEPMPTAPTEEPTEGGETEEEEPVF